ncbi:cytochrome P450 [Pholiota conissans]|uniref:Cytochrome P450 n=1 Tax=Pholiota conissans TaxID=109636 RepID=A0A9P5Z8X3_9AGAR|nr:cytochrome P450 [Pholiota conissans]
MSSAQLKEVLLQPQTIAAVALCLTTIAFIHQRFMRASRLPLPPGPPQGILGNSLPKAFAYRKFEEWTQQYGPVISLRQGLTYTVVVGRMQAAIDIMEREGAWLVDRPQNIAAGETLSGGMRMLLTPAGDRFKKMRRAMHAHLQPKLISTYSPTLMKNARQQILDLIEQPENHQDHAKRYSAAVVMALAYGKNVKSYEDPEVVSVNRCLTRLGNALRPGIWKVEAYPFLRYIPGYLKELQEGHAEELALFKDQLLDLKKQADRGEEVPQSFGKYLLERQSELDLSANEMAYLAGSMFGAGSDTTASAISISVMAAVLHPEAQARVQKELDAVVGHERAPAMSDQEMLPQTMAFVLESFRWRPVSAGGFAHKATKDIYWKGYLIPKGASVIGNVWAIGRDPEYFPDPESFNPQRWINKDGKLREDLHAYTFGSGRRVCPGQHIATASVFINTALIQWAFSLKPDPFSPIDPLAFTESANTHPLPFKVILEPRAAKTMAGVRELMEDYGL